MNEMSENHLLGQDHETEFDGKLRDGEKLISKEVLGDVICEHVAVTDQGRRIFSKGYMLEEETVAVLERLESQGAIKPLTEDHVVTFDELRELYDTYSADEDDDKREGRVIRLMRKVFYECASVEASDIRIEIGAKKTTVAAVTKSATVPVDEWNRTDGQACINKLFHLSRARADGSALAPGVLTYRHDRETHVDEYGHFYPSNISALRVATSDTLTDHVLVARLIYVRNTAAQKSLWDLYEDEEDRVYLREAITNLEGGTWLSGPTDSGKSTSGLKVGNAIYDHYDGKVNLWELGNPCETTNENFVQLSVDDAAGDLREEYNAKMRFMVRSNPTWVFAQETRDLEGAELFFALLQQGKGGLTTVHAINCAEIPFRLIGMGMNPYTVADPRVLNLLMNQRLVYQLCEHCSLDVTEAAMNEALIGDHFRDPFWKDVWPGAKMRNPEGCSKCHAHKDGVKKEVWNGFSKITVVPEFLKPDYRFLELVQQNNKLEALRYWVQDMQARTLPMRLREMLSRGLLDPRHAVAKGAFGDKQLRVQLQARPARAA